MIKHRSVTLLRSLFSLFLLGLLALSLTQCGAAVPPTSGTPRCGAPQPCAGPADCQGSGFTVPLCAQASSGYCTAQHTCVWKLTPNSSCPCIENDVQFCTLANNAPGVSICTSNGSTPPSTSWGQCNSCPSCSPWASLQPERASEQVATTAACSTLRL